MQTPCTNCVNQKISKDGHRIFSFCSGSESKKGFEYDNWSYNHTCKNQVIHKKCESCDMWKPPYCKNNYTECPYEE